MAGNHLKILMTTDTVGGVWTYCMELCRALQPSGAEVHLVTMGAPMKDWQRREVTASGIASVHETNFALEWMHNPWNDIEECGEWLLRLEEELQPDIIHLNCFAYGCYSFKAPKIIVTHSDVYSWFLNVKKDDPPPEWQKYFWCVKKGLQGADLVIAPSHDKLRSIKSVYSISNNTRVIYNGRSKELFRAAPKQNYVFSMGRVWDEGKNTQLLVDAAPMIKAPLRIAGDNEFAANHFDSLNSGVEYLGSLSTSEVAQQLSGAPIYALPGKYDPFGLSALEAAFSKCALVLGDIETLREIWGDNALYVHPDDKNELAETINYLLENPTACEEYGNKAYNHAQRYSPEIMAAEYLKAYQELSRNRLRAKELT